MTPEPSIASDESHWEGAECETLRIFAQSISLLGRLEIAVKTSLGGW